MSDRAAVLDCGTNTVRLVIAENTAKGVRRVVSTSHPTQLGDGVTETGSISADALHRARSMAQEYAGLIQEHGVAPENIHAIGTASLREAENGAAFEEILQQHLAEDLRVTVLSGEEEAQLTWEAVRDFAEELSAPYLVADLGGGSLELVSGSDPDTPGHECSLPLGSRWLTRQYLQGDPPSDEKGRRLSAAIAEQLSTPEAHSVLKDAAGASVICVGGSAKQVAKLLRAQKGESEKLHGYTVSTPELRAQTEMLGLLSEEQRRALPGMKTSRAETSYAGAYVLGEVLDRVGASSMRVSKHNVADAYAATLLRERAASSPLSSPAVIQHTPRNSPGTPPYSAPPSPPSSPNAGHTPRFRP